MQAVPSRSSIAGALRKIAALTLALGLTLLTVGCHHKTQQAYAPPPPPVTRQSHPRPTTPPVVARRQPESNPGPDPVHGKPSFTETGMASWYGASGHRAADGSKFDGTGMTAAHKTLPLGSTVRVTNLVNNESIMVKITDRGPFSHGRIIDLSEGAAKKIDLYRMGIAKVKVEAFTPATASAAGKWVVQAGAFQKEGDAIDLKTALIKHYAGSRVIEFKGATGYWVRIDPPTHDHTQAEAILEWIGKPDPEVVPYLVRVD
jgi:rare lipoprotein A